MLDEAFIDFCEAESAKKLVPYNNGTLLLRSMTKFFAIPGLRLGYAIASQEVIARLETLSPPWSVNTLAQLAGIASLADAPYIRRTVDYVASESSFLAAELAAIPGLLPHPSAANYLLVEVKKGPPAGILRDLLLEKRILIRSCANFAGLDDSSFRVAVRTRGENEIFLSALREIFVKKNG